MIGTTHEHPKWAGRCSSDSLLKGSDIKTFITVLNRFSQHLTSAPGAGTVHVPGPYVLWCPLVSAYDEGNSLKLLRHPSPRRTHFLTGCKQVAAACGVLDEQLVVSLLPLSCKTKAGSKTYTPSAIGKATLTAWAVYIPRLPGMILGKV